MKNNNFLKFVFYFIAGMVIFAVYIYITDYTDSKDTFKDDRDGKKYGIVKIGSQTWMAKNLSYSTSKTGCYDNESDNCVKYGRLYDWENAMKSCPKGWHLPTEKEWEALVKFAGEDAIKKLLAQSLSHGGTNELGFSALLGGYWNSQYNFKAKDTSSYWWSATEYDKESASAFLISINAGKGLGWQNINTPEKSDMLSVRCIHN